MTLPRYEKTYTSDAHFDPTRLEDWNWNWAWPERKYLVVTSTGEPARLVDIQNGEGSRLSQELLTAGYVIFFDEGHDTGWGWLSDEAEDVRAKHREGGLHYARVGMGNSDPTEPRAAFLPYDPHSLVHAALLVS